ncbi:MAG: class E sortase [Gaiella sp.]|nr:class E sortase [Gaiella sp.]
METAARTTSVALSRGRWLRRLGTLLIVAGVCGLVWALVTWQWNDPLTAVYTRWQQSRLEDQYRAVVEREAPRPPAAALQADPSEVAAVVRESARRYRANAQEGGAIGRIVVPRLGLDMIFVNGTDSGTLKKGPGRDPRTFMPGQGELVYIAGHRTTYLAPFSHIDRLRPGDRVTLEMPYATFAYRVTGHRIVAADDLSVLRSHGREVVALQACHPRFFATHRYIVWARPVRMLERAGRVYALPVTAAAR